MQRNRPNAVDRLSEGLVRYLRDLSETQIRDGLEPQFQLSAIADERALILSAGVG